MANWLSYVGYTSGSSGSTKIALSEKMDNDLYRANINGIIVDDGNQETILDYMRDLHWD